MNRSAQPKLSNLLSARSDSAMLTMAQLVHGLLHCELAHRLLRWELAHHLVHCELAHHLVRWELAHGLVAVSWFTVWFTVAHDEARFALAQSLHFLQKAKFSGDRFLPPPWNTCSRQLR